MSQVTCEICPRGCVIPEGGAGDCRIRVNLGGELRATTYGRPSAIHIDPMEKKPLYHFLPGTPVFSIATAGCNLRCRAKPAEVVAAAQAEGCRGIAYTYSDPVVFYEYCRDTSALVHARGLRNVFVTAAYINPKPMRALCRVLDAANADLEALDEGFYREVNGASLKPVLDAMVVMREEGVWLELTNLVVPTLNDDLAMIRRMSRWILRELGADTPLHFSRFQPMYRMRNLPPTPAATLDQARAEALDVGLHHVYIGNLMGHAGNHTYCPRDGTLLIARTGYRITENRLTVDGRCPTCNQAIAGVWQ